MRFKNFSNEPLKVITYAWTHPAEPGSLIEVAQTFDPGEVSDDYEPADPVAKKLLKAHPELRPYTFPSCWERLLRDF